jgi:hypothetical protein
MSSRISTLISLPSLVAAILLASPSAAADLHLLGAVSYSWATACSDDGRVVAGYDPQSYWYWTLDTGVIQLIGTTISPGNGVGGQASITSDGRFMTVSTLQGPEPQKAEATLYDIENIEYRSIGSWGYNCDIERSGAWNMSPDGQTVVGLAWEIGCKGKGFSWSNATNVMTSLPSLYFFKPTRANGVSDSGGTVAGWNDDYNGFRQAAAWVKNASGIYVATAISAPPPKGSTTPIKMREAQVVSGNGQWVYGLGKSTYNGGAMWKWSEATGVLPILPAPVTDIGYPTAVNSDGSRVLGFFGMLGGNGGYLWSEGTGYVSVNQLAINAGITIPEGWSLTMPLGMSEDGLTIVGTAWGPISSSPFVLDLRPGKPVCDADLDGDLTVGAADLSMLLAVWGTFGGSDADLDGDGTVGAADLSLLLATWGACP